LLAWGIAGVIVVRQSSKILDWPNALADNLGEETKSIEAGAQGRETFISPRRVLGAPNGRRKLLMSSANGGRWSKKGRYVQRIKNDQLYRDYTRGWKEHALKSHCVRLDLPLSAKFQVE